MNLLAQSYFEIGGRIVECGIDINYQTSDMTRKQQREYKRTVREVVKTGKHAGKAMSESLSAAQENRFGFEEAGQMAGLWVGLSLGIASMPVVALDGPLPFVDAAWLFATARMTKSAIDIGGNIGSTIDDLIGMIA